MVWNQFPGTDILYGYVPAGGSPAPAVNISGTPGTASYATRLAVGPTGAVHAVWREHTGNGPLDILYATKPFNGGWSAPQNLTNDSADSGNPEVAEDALGDVHLAWSTPIGGGGYALWHLRRPVGAPWPAVTEAVKLSADSSDTNNATMLRSASGSVDLTWWKSIGSQSDVMHATILPDLPEISAAWVKAEVAHSNPPFGFDNAWIFHFTNTSSIDWTFGARVLLRAPDGDTVDLGTKTATVAAGATFAFPFTDPWRHVLDQSGPWYPRYIVYEESSAPFDTILADTGFITDPFHGAVTVPLSLPTADPNGPYSGVEGIEINFDGSNSNDPEGDLLTYDWNFGDGESSTGVQLPHAYADNGTYEACLTVTDPIGLSDTKCSEVTVDNSAPTVDAGDDQSVLSGDTVEITATFGDVGVDDAPWNYIVDWGDGSTDTGSTADQSAPILAKHVYLVPDQYEVTVTVKDKDGGEGSDSVDVSVKPIPVAIDIKPGSHPNAIRVGGKGKVPVAVLGGGSVDLTEIDDSTVRFGPSEAEGVASGPNIGKLEDVDADGADDRTYQFQIADTGIADGDSEACLTGQMADGRYFEGCDSVKTVPAKKAKD